MCELEKIINDYRAKGCLPCSIYLNEVASMCYCDAEGAVRGAMAHANLLAGAGNRGAVIDYTPPPPTAPLYRFTEPTPLPTSWEPGKELPFHHNQSACDLPHYGASILCCAMPNMVNGRSAGWHGCIIICPWAAPVATKDEATNGH